MRREDHLKKPLLILNNITVRLKFKLLADIYKFRLLKCTFTRASNNQ